MSQACATMDASALFGSAVYTGKPAPPTVRILSSYAQRCLLLNGHAIPVGERRNMIIGCDPLGCNVLLLGARVNAKHAEILFHNGCYFVQDLGSTHGTYVNGRRITGAAELRVGDEIRINPYRMIFATAG